MTARFWAQVEYDGTDLAGFQLQAQPWHDENDPALVEKIAGGLATVGTDAASGDCQSVEGDIRKLRFSLTANEIERFLALLEEKDLLSPPMTASS